MSSRKNPQVGDRCELKSGFSKQVMNRTLPFLWTLRGKAEGQVGSFVPIASGFRQAIQYRSLEEAIPLGNSPCRRFPCLSAAFEPGIGRYRPTVALWVQSMGSRKVRRCVMCLPALRGEAQKDGGALWIESDRLEL